MTQVVAGACRYQCMATRDGTSEQVRDGRDALSASDRRLRAGMMALTAVMLVAGGLAVVAAAVLHGEAVARFLAVGFGVASTAMVSVVLVFLNPTIQPMPDRDHSV